MNRVQRMGEKLGRKRERGSGRKEIIRKRYTVERMRKKLGRKRRRGSRRIGENWENE